MRAPTFACCTYLEPDAFRLIFQFVNIFHFIIVLFLFKCCASCGSAAMCKVFDFVYEFGPLWLLAFGKRKPQMILQVDEGDF